jgi:predicted transcriptional regulator
LDEDQIIENIFKLLENNGELTFNEIKNSLGWLGDNRALRKILSNLIREGKIERIPNYERRRMAFRVKRYEGTK